MDWSVQETLDTDVLIIGSGGAGVTAALKTIEQGCDCIVVSKGEDSTSEISALNVPLGHADPRDSPDALLRDVLHTGEYLNNAVLARILAEESEERLRDLVGMGVRFEWDDDRFKQRLTAGNTYPRSVYYRDVLGRQIMAHAMRKIEGEGVKLLKNVMIFTLLMDQRRVAGALGFNFIEKYFLAIRSKTVVLATGGAGQLYSFTTNGRGLTGDGYAMAYACGAELVDMEFIQFEPTVAAHPGGVRGTVLPTALLGEGAVLLNSRGERFMQRYDAIRKELTSKDLLCRAVFLEVEEGRGTEHGGVLFDASKLPRETIERRFPATLRRLLKGGVDIREMPVEVAPACHYMMGGVVIDERCQTSVSGLYAAGEVSGGVHGANRVAGGSAADILVFGHRAGKYASKRASTINFSFSREEISQVSEKYLVSLSRRGRVDSSGEIRRRLQGVMWDCVGISRRREGLISAVEETSSLRGEIATMKAGDFGELKNLLETENLLAVGEISARSALHREESRGTHYRADFPSKDDERWLVNIIVSKRGIAERKALSLG
ncbi:MAG: FAD-binding protein [Candidatus Geothermarchaeales archaeon]